MKFFIITLLLAYAAADVSHILPKHTGEEREAKILSQELDVDPQGNYRWSIETENGIGAHEHGELQNAGSENAAIAAAGAAQWTAPNGETVSLTYKADENGYQPEGSHLPTPPPIPEAILRSLEYIRAHPPPPEKK